MTVSNFTGVQIYKSDWLKDGTITRINTSFFVGVALETDDQHRARVIVRTGLRDVLMWLGEPVLTGRELMEKLKTG